MPGSGRKALQTDKSPISTRSWGSLPWPSSCSSLWSTAEESGLSLSQFTSRMAPWPSGPQVQDACGGEDRGQRCCLYFRRCSQPQCRPHRPRGRRPRVRLKSSHGGNCDPANVNPACGAWREPGPAPKAGSGGDRQWQRDRYRRLTRALRASHLVPHCLEWGGEAGPREMDRQTFHDRL